MWRDPVRRFLSAAQLILLFFSFFPLAIAPFAHAQGQDQESSAESERLFLEIRSVLVHPRCLNCHVKTPFPKQGDDFHAHRPPVARGPDGKGVAGLMCASCHQTANFTASGVPGAPNWHLAPLSMEWENKTPAELCRVLLDKSKNGNRDVAALVRHMTEDSLVAWGWAPGIDADGRARETAPIPKPEFNRIVHAWADSGAKCPE